MHKTIYDMGEFGHAVLDWIGLSRV